MRFYHGTANLFKEFDKKSIGRNFRESEDSGFFFISSKKRAEYIADSRGDGPSFVYEVDLDFENPVKDSVDSEFISPCDKYDMNPENYTREAFIERKDAIHIKGTMNDDLLVVFEPSQIVINRVFEDGVEIYNKHTPELTKYPEVMGSDIESRVNKDSILFHDHAQSEEERFSYAFGDLLDTDANGDLEKNGFFSYGDGRHFFLGDTFKQATFNLFCKNENNSSIPTSHRENCLIAYDFETGITMVHDLTGSGEEISELLKRPYQEGTGLIKRFESDGHESRDLLMAIGQPFEIDKIEKSVPEYELEFIGFERVKPQETMKSDADTERAVFLRGRDARRLLIP